VQSVAPIFQLGLEKLSSHPLVGEIRSIGLLGAIELVKNKQTRSTFDLVDGAGALLAKRAEANGLISRNMGDSLALAPPLIIEERQIMELLRIVKLSLDETFDMLTQSRIN